MFISRGKAMYIKTPGYIRIFTSGLFIFCLISIVPQTGQAQENGHVTVFAGARLISGHVNDVLENSILIIKDDRITQVGRRGEIVLPEMATIVDLTGKTIMPAIIDTHKHLANERGRLMEQLQELASYGVGAVLSLGLDDSELVYQMRNEVIPGAPQYLTAGRGITMPEPGRSEAAYGTPPAAYWITSVEEGREAVREQAELGVDFIKIWVDDRGGRYEKMSPEMYAAIIDEAHKQGIQVAAHIHYLEDAKDLLRAGVDVFAHGVRESDVDAELIQLFQERPEVILAPNLPDEGVAIDMRYLRGLIPDDVVDTVEVEYAGTPEDQAFYQIQARNLAALNEAGVKIAFGTDGREMYEVFIELENMVAAGMTAEEVIVAATKTSAELLGLDDTGTLEPGKRADFIILDANPIEDITNIRQIDSVFLRGQKVDR
jgi:imidazolonepropionase-like amidohydrolase